MNLVKQLLVNKKLRAQWGGDYPSTTQVVSHVIVLHGFGQLPWWSIDVYLWRRSSPLCREYNIYIIGKIFCCQLLSEVKSLWTEKPDNQAIAGGPKHQEAQIAKVIFFKLINSTVQMSVVWLNSVVTRTRNKHFNQSIFLETWSFWNKYLIKILDICKEWMVAWDGLKGQ